MVKQQLYPPFFTADNKTAGICSVRTRLHDTVPVQTYLPVIVIFHTKRLSVLDAVEDHMYPFIVDPATRFFGMEMVILAFHIQCLVPGEILRQQFLQDKPDPVFGIWRQLVPDLPPGLQGLGLIQRVL